MLCWRLQYRHSCQYFVWTLFYFIFCFVLFHTHSVYCCKVNADAKVFVLLLTVAMWWKAERVQIHATSDWFGLFCTVVTLSASGLTSVRRLPVESWKSKNTRNLWFSGMFYRLYSWPTNQGSGSRRHRQNQCQKLVSYPIRSLKKVPHTVIQPHHYI